MNARLADFDLSTGRQALRGYLSRLGPSLQSLDQPVYANRLDALASGYLAMGNFFYALGYPQDLVRTAFAAGGEAFRRRCVLRDASPKKQLIEQGGKPDSISNFGVTSSAETYRFMSLAIIAGNWELANLIGERCWDPPGASYITPKSECCTPTDQKLARGLIDLLHTRTLDAEMANLPARPETPLSEIVAAPILGELMFLLQSCDWLRFENRLWMLAGDYARVRQKRGFTGVQFFFSTTALALMKVAKHRGWEALKSPDDELLPLELIQSDNHGPNPCDPEYHFPTFSQVQPP